MWYIIIYLIGCICTAVTVLYSIAKEYEEITVIDVAVALLSGIASWIGLFISVVMLYPDTVIWEKKK